MNRWAVILAGGVGSRFWPLSTPQRPKQLLPLVDDAPLLVNTLRRLAPAVPPERTLVITNAALADSVRAIAPALPPNNVIGEPRAAGTAPALAWAALEIERRDADTAVMLCVHADWAIGDDAGFRATLERAAAVAERHAALVTVGVVPARPDPGLGYLQPGEAVDGARRVARFVEKPDRSTAERLVKEGCLWNSGIFVWRVQDFLEEVHAHTPEISAALGGTTATDIHRFFEAVRPITVDQGVMERSARVLMLPGDFGWDDVGTWAALHRVREHDAGGNALAGRAHAIDANGNVVHAESGTVVLYGVRDLVVVTRPGLTLVTTRDRATDLKSLLDRLPPNVREVE
ncbi:MAG: mannose-1-phosphate guanylyltransferase [Gemmatimonadaceae bacterium]